MVLVGQVGTVLSSPSGLYPSWFNGGNGFQLVVPRPSMVTSENGTLQGHRHESHGRKVGRMVITLGGKLQCCSPRPSRSKGPWNRRLVCRRLACRYWAPRLRHASKYPYLLVSSWASVAGVRPAAPRVTKWWEVVLPLTRFTNDGM